MFRDASEAGRKGLESYPPKSLPEASSAAVGGHGEYLPAVIRLIRMERYREAKKLESAASRIFLLCLHPFWQALSKQVMMQGVDRAVADTWCAPRSRVYRVDPDAGYFPIDARFRGYRVGHQSRGARRRVSLSRCFQSWRRASGGAWSAARSKRIASTYSPTGENPLVTLSTHMDTVPPFFPSREDADFIWGRGSADAKGIIASMIGAAEGLLERGAQFRPALRRGRRAQ